MNRLKKLYHNSHFWHYLAYGISLFGLLVSSYLWYEYQQPGEIGCTLKGCQTVRESAFAKIAGIDMPLLGMLYYLVILIYITSLFIERPKWKYEGYLFILFNLGGALFSLYLTYLEVFVIEAICQYCVMSAVASIAGFIVSANFVTNRKVPDLEYAEA